MYGACIMMSGTGRSDKNGAFTIASVAPGDYVLQSRALQITMSGGGDNMMFTARVGGGPDGGGADSEVGSLPITVAGEDLSNVVLVTAKGATATGRLAFEGGTAPNGITNIRVMPVAADGDGGPTMVLGNANSVKADGSFEGKGLLGTRLLRLMNLPAGRMVKTERVKCTELTDTG